MLGLTDPDRMWSLVLLLVLVSSGNVSAYSLGAPSSACNSMRPGHAGQPQTSQSPYSVSLSQTTYTPGQQITVTIQGSSSFKGFMIQPRPSADTFTTLGSFNTPSNSKNPCSGTQNIALTHTGSEGKTSFSVVWTAPMNYEGDVVFVYTVVQNYMTYWVKQVSDVVRYQAGPTNPPTQPPTTTQPPATTQPPVTTQPPATTQPRTTTQSPTTTQSTAQGTINPDPECGVTKGCFPAACSNSCNYLVTWKDRGEEIEFSLQLTTTLSDYYVAIGFSSDPKMGEDSVADCIAINGLVDVHSSYNHAYKYNEALAIPTYGVTMLSGSLVNGVLSCQFLRKKSAAFVTAGAGGRKKREVVGGESSFFDLEQDWYLFVAHGQAVSGVKQMHSVRPVISPQKIDFQKVTMTTPSTPDPGPSDGVVEKDSECGDTLGCFHDCEGDNCGFLLTWKDNGDDVDISLTCKQIGNAYCAIGLSKDEKMGDDSVFECVSTGGQVDAYVSYNKKDGRDNSRLTSDQFGLTITSGSHVNGILRCVFSRKKTAGLAMGSTGRRKRTVVADSSSYFDMNSDWYLLSAFGTSIGGYLNKHTVQPLISSKKADFQSFEDIGAKAVKNNLIKAHGILMTVAWMFSATLGIYMARFYKNTWPAGMEWFGDKRWFVLHRGLMINVTVMTIAGVVLIFVHVEGWAEISGSNFEKSHPILGIIVAAFAIINPIMAFFRPKPDAPRRPVFKGFHILVGVAAYICAIVNIFSGTMLAAAHVPKYVRIILYVFCGWISVMDLVLHIHNCCKHSDKDEWTSPILGYNSKRGEAYEMKSSASAEHGQAEAGQKVDTFRVGMMILHTLALIGMAVAVAVIIGTSKPDHDH